MIQEIWEPISGYEGLYEVSNLGNVRSVDRVVISSRQVNRRLKGKLLSPSINNRGYQYVNLVKGGRSKSVTIHKLVALAFIPNPKDKPCIDHINAIRTDNRSENLRWCSHRENQNFPIATSKRKVTRVNMYTKKGEFVKQFKSITDAEREIGVSHSNICASCAGRRNEAGGFKWEYAKEHDSGL